VKYGKCGDCAYHPNFHRTCDYCIYAGELVKICKTSKSMFFIEASPAWNWRRVWVDREFVRVLSPLETITLGAEGKLPA